MATSVSKVNMNITDRIQQRRIQGDKKLVEKNLKNKDDINFLDIVFFPDEIHERANGKKGLSVKFLYKGDEDSEFNNGYFLGEVLLHPEYPKKAGDIRMLTPNGRFEAGKMICMDNTAFHQNDMTGGMKAGWNVWTIIMGFISVWTDEDENGIAHMSRGQMKYENKGDIEQKMKVLRKFRRKSAKDSVAYNAKHYPEYFNKFTRMIDGYKSHLPSGFKVKT